MIFCQVPWQNEYHPPTLFNAMIYAVYYWIPCHEISLVEKQVETIIHLNIQPCVSLLSLLHENIQNPWQIFFTAMLQFEGSKNNLMQKKWESTKTAKGEMKMEHQNKINCVCTCSKRMHQILCFQSFQFCFVWVLYSLTGSRIEETWPL